MSLVQRLSQQLQQSLDANFKVTNVEAVLEVIEKLEGIPITKEQLETTRLAKFINGLRRQTTDDNLAKRSKNLLREWRKSVMPALASVPQPSQQRQPQPSAAGAATNSGSYFVNNISSIQQNGVSALGQPLGVRQLPMPTTTLTISSASSSPLMPQQQLPQTGLTAANINRPYNGTNSSTANPQQQTQSHYLNSKQPVNLTMMGGDTLLKQRQINQPMNCDNNSTNNSFLLSANTNTTTSDLSDNSQQSTRRNKSAKKEKKSKKPGKDVSNNNFPSITSFGGVITGKPMVNHHHDSNPPPSAASAFYDGSNNSKNKVVKPAAARSLQQPFLFNGDSLSSSQSMSNFSFGGASGTRGTTNSDNLSFSGHFSKVKTTTTPTTYPQSQMVATPNLTTTAPSINLIDDDDVVLINSSRSHSPFNTATMTSAAAVHISTDPTPLEILVKESMTPVATVVPVAVAVPEVKTPKKRGRKKGSKGIDSQLHLQNAINMPSTSSGGRELNSYLDMKQQIDSLLPKTKKLKTTQELYAELQNRSKVASASTSTQVSPSSSSEQSLSTVVDSVASRMATPDPTSQDLFEASTSKGGRRNNVAVKKEETGIAVKEEKSTTAPPLPPPLPENIEEQIKMMLEQLPPIDYRAAFEENEAMARKAEVEGCLCTMEVITPEIVPAVEIVPDDVEPTDVAVSITIPSRQKPDVRTIRKEPVAPIKPQKQVKSIFDLDYDDDNDPIHDFRNSAQPEIEEKRTEPEMKIEISVPVLPEAVTVAKPEHTVVPPSEPVIVVPAPPVFQVEYDIHPNCPAMKMYETNPQQITKFHLDALHHQFVPNVNGNWSDLPVYVPHVIKLDEPTDEGAIKSESEEADGKLFERVVPPYNFLHYEAIPKTHPGLETDNVSDIKMKLLWREEMYRRQREEATNQNNESHKRKANHIESDDDDDDADFESPPVNKRIKMDVDKPATIIVQNAAVDLMDAEATDELSGGEADASDGEERATKDNVELKREKLKELQQSMALSSFLDPNYTFYYKDQDPQQSEQQAEHINIDGEVAVPFENNNLDLRIRADVNSDRVTEMLRMTIDDDIDIRNENFFNLKLNACTHDRQQNDHLSATMPQQSTENVVKVKEEESVLHNGQCTTMEADKQMPIKPDIRLLVTSQMNAKDDPTAPFVPLSTIHLGEDQRDDRLELESNNELLPSFNNIEFDLPALTTAPPPEATKMSIKQEPNIDESDGVEPTSSSASTSERFFREWQDCLNVRSYNDEVITLLPYVVID